MSQPALGSTLSPDIVRDTVERANAWYAKAAYLTQAADNLLTAAGLPLPSREPSVLPPNVFSLTAARARRQAVTR